MGKVSIEIKVDRFVIKRVSLHDCLILWFEEERGVERWKLLKMTL